MGTCEILQGSFMLNHPTKCSTFCLIRGVHPTIWVHLLPNIWENRSGICTYAAVRTSSTLEGSTNQFGWLQAYATTLLRCREVYRYDKDLNPERDHYSRWRDGITASLTMRPIFSRFHQFELLHSCGHASQGMVSQSGEAS
jgi:hypothetical protein